MLKRLHKCVLRESGRNQREDPIDGGYGLVGLSFLSIRGRVHLGSPFSCATILMPLARIGAVLFANASFRS